LCVASRIRMRGRTAPGRQSEGVEAGLGMGRHQQLETPDTAFGGLCWGGTPVLHGCCYRSLFRTFRSRQCFLITRRSSVQGPSPESAPPVYGSSANKGGRVEERTKQARPVGQLWRKGGK
jgi:hypothetical protein